MPATFLIADTHLGHDMVARLRGFADAVEHDDRLAERWHRQVGPEDHVWLLGDVAMGDRRAHLRRIATWPGVKHLVLGNHDRPHPLHRNAHAHLGPYEEAFESIQLGAKLRHPGLSLLLSHFPYDGDHTEEERHTQWRLRDLGTPLIHGHTHSTEVVTRSAAGTPQICVSLDAWPTRFPTLAECAELASGR